MLLIFREVEALRLHGGIKIRICNVKEPEQTEKKMNQIPGFYIFVIFVMALGLAISNEKVVLSVSRVISTVISEDFATVSRKPLEEDEVESLYEMSQTDLQDEEMTPAQQRPPKCLVNLHIPKVGGRTVGNFLHEVANITGFERYTLYGHQGEQDLGDVLSGKRAGNNSASSADDQDSNTMIHQDYHQNIMVQGHFTTRIFAVYPQLEECLIMTVLRQPVDRVISAFFFHNHRRPDIVKCLSPENYNPSNGTENATLDNSAEPELSSPGLIIQRGNSTSLVSDTTIDPRRAKQQLARARMRKGGNNRSRCKLFWQYMNDVTLRFAGLPELPWKSWEMSGSSPRKNLHRGVKRVAPFPVSSIPRMNETHLAEAKDNMKKYLGLVCFLHDLPSCAERILQAFQLDSSEVDDSIMNTNKTTRFKTKSRPDKLKENELEMFRGANQLDQELYDWALEMYS